MVIYLHYYSVCLITNMFSLYDQNVIYAKDPRLLLVIVGGGGGGMGIYRGVLMQHLDLHFSR